MKLLRLGPVFLFALLAVSHTYAAAPRPDANPRLTQSFDADWRFFKSDATGAEATAFDDATWRQLSVPHDWSIEGPFDEKNPTGGAGAYLPSGVAWYRKHFTLPESTKGQRVFIEFDGVMQNSEVFINGHKLGQRPFGYVSFSYELTGQLTYGAAANVLAVRTDTSAQPASRWYSGAGIYRHVRLVVTSPVHVEQWGTFVSTPTATAASATVHAQTTVLNQSDAATSASVLFTITDPAGKIVAQAEAAAQSIAAGERATFTTDIAVASPQLWDLAHPTLYQATAIVRRDKTTLDRDRATFGIRDAHFEPERGFVLNGQPLKLYGVCLHHDGGAFGAAVPLDVWRQRLTTLRTLGVNAIRTAHNPPAPEFLDLCDEMGFLVMDEMFDCWTVAKNRFDYHLFFEEWSKRDTRDTVRRDRNHPSIVLYSAGNEIHDTPKEDLAKSILAGLVPVFHENDPTRAVTQALFRPNVSHDYTNGLADLLDVVGTNYRDSELLAAQRAKPSRKIVGTEQRHDRETWLNLRDNPSHSGQFLWSGVDYLGEALRWPVVSASSGLLDRTGKIKPMARERQSWWSTSPMVAITRRVGRTQRGPTDPGFETVNRRQSQFADWSPENREPHDESVEIFSNADSVELFLNDHSLGEKPINADASPRIWSVPFAPGTLRAIAKNKGTVVATDELRTAGAPAKLVLTTEQTKLTAGDWNSVTQLRVSVVDAQGIVVPSATSLITFAVTGPGQVAAVDNGDPSSHESFQAVERHAAQGTCTAFIRATAPGTLTITASTPGLTSATVQLTAH